MKLFPIKQNLLFVRFVNYGGGAESSVSNLLKFNEAKSIAINDLCFSEFKKNRNFLQKFFSIYRFFFHIRNESKSVDYLIACVEGAPFLLAKIATIGRSKPTVLWLHCEPTEYLKFVSYKQRILIRLSIFFADNIICASPWYANYIALNSNKKAHFLPNFIGVNPNLFINTDQYNICRSRFLYVGSLTKLKNISACFSFFASLRYQNCTYFDIYGDGPERENLIGKSVLLNSNCFVSFKGHVAVDWQSHSAKSILLVPSFTEALPMVIVEALLYGIPVIVNKYKGHQFFSTHDGLVESVEFDCPSAVIKVSEVLSNLSSSEYNRRLYNTKLFLLNNFDNDKNLISFMEFLGSINK